VANRMGARFTDNRVVAGQSALSVVGDGWRRNWITGNGIRAAGDGSAWVECDQTGYVIHRIDHLVDQDDVSDRAVVDCISIVAVGTAGHHGWVCW